MKTPAIAGVSYSTLFSITEKILMYFENLQILYVQILNDQRIALYKCTARFYIVPH